jgi:multidrug efflux pump subunit AcrA (membrane-fusion protein)
MATKAQLKTLVKGARFGRHEEATLLQLIESSACGAAKQAALTAADAAAVDATYGSQESGVITNIRTRVGQIEAALQAFGIIP